MVYHYKDDDDKKGERVWGRLGGTWVGLCVPRATMPAHGYCTPAASSFERGGHSVGLPSLSQTAGTSSSMNFPTGLAQAAHKQP